MVDILKKFVAKLDSLASRIEDNQERVESPDVWGRKKEKSEAEHEIDTYYTVKT